MKTPVSVKLAIAEKAPVAGPAVQLTFAVHLFPDGGFGVTLVTASWTWPPPRVLRLVCVSNWNCDTNAKAMNEPTLVRLEVAVIGVEPIT